MKDMADQHRTTDLPERLRGYFWDYDADHLTWRGSRHTIVLRLLQSGGMDAVQWLREHMSDEEIREFLVRRRGRGISPRRLRFWGLVLGVPRSQVDEWIAVARANPWHRRAH
jgi:hypothetical protein